MPSSASIKGCFLFSVPSPAPVAREAPFHDPFGPDLAHRIIHQLRLRDFQVSDAKPGKACDAGFRISMQRGSIEVVLLVTRASQEIRCALLTWPHRALLRPKSQDYILRQWAEAATAIEHILRSEPEITSLLRLSRHEAETRATDFAKQADRKPTAREQQ